MEIDKFYASFANHILFQGKTDQTLSIREVTQSITGLGFIKKKSNYEKKNFISVIFNQKKEENELYQLYSFSLEEINIYFC